MKHEQHVVPLEANPRPGAHSYRECDARCSASHCSLIQPRVEEFAPPGTRIREITPTAINRMAKPTMNSMVGRRNHVGVLAILTRGEVTVCAVVNKASATGHARTSGTKTALRAIESTASATECVFT